LTTKTAIISIDDLTSQTIGTLSDLLKAVPGVDSIEFNIERKVAVAEFDPTRTHVDELLRAVLKAGFHVS
jgi:copper chaperone CopZ